MFWVIFTNSHFVKKKGFFFASYHGIFDELGHLKPWISYYFGANFPVFQNGSMLYGSLIYIIFNKPGKGVFYGSCQCFEKIANLKKIKVSILQLKGAIFNKESVKTGSLWEQRTMIGTSSLYGCEVLGKYPLANIYGLQWSLQINDIHNIIIKHVCMNYWCAFDVRICNLSLSDLDKVGQNHLL